MCRSQLFVFNRFFIIFTPFTRVIPKILFLKVCRIGFKSVLSNNPIKGDIMGQEDNNVQSVEQKQPLGAEKTTMTKKKPFWKSREGIILQVVLFPITIIAWLVYAIIKIPTLLTGVALRELKENFIDYLFTKEVKDESGETVAVKFISMPKIFIGAHFCVTLPLIMALIAYFLPHTDVACSFVALLLPIISVAIIIYDLPVIKFWGYVAISAIAVPLIDFGWYKLFEYCFGTGIDIFSLLNKAILGINPVFNTGAFIMMSILWFIVLAFPVLHALLQSRFEITDKEVYSVKLGERSGLVSQYGKIVTGKFDIMESIFSGTGGIKIKHFTRPDEDALKIDNVPGLGNWFSTLVFCPWAFGIKKAIERLNQRDHSVA